MTPPEITKVEIPARIFVEGLEVFEYAPMYYTPSKVVRLLWHGHDLLQMHSSSNAGDADLWVKVRRVGV